MNFVETILGHMESDSGGACLTELRGNDLVPLSRPEFRALVANARGFLSAAGVRPGDRVALLAPNSARWIAADLAIVSEGAITVPLYARQSASELGGILRDAAPALLIVDGEALESAILPSWEGRVARYDAVFSAKPRAESPYPLSPADPVTIIYTSGTTGEPKGVVYTRANVDFMLPTTAKELQELTGAGSAGDRVFHFLPFCFAGSRIMLWMQLYRGNPLWLSTDLSRLADEMRSADPQYCLCVPLVLERIRQTAEKKIEEIGGIVSLLVRSGREIFRRRADGRARPGDALCFAILKRVVFRRIRKTIGRNLEFFICGSAPLSIETHRWFQMIGLPIYQVYGLTETTAIVTMDRPRQVEPGRIGYAIPGCEVRLSDQGELLCRGPNVFAGYWKKPEATTECLREGWFHTGDQAEVDVRGNWKVVGRLKNLLKPESGHSIAPEPLEQRLIEAGDGIEQAMVIGHGRPYLVAIVTGPVTEKAIENTRVRVNEILPHYQRIRRVMRVAEPFTPENALLTINGKLRRNAIEARFHSEIEALYRG